jgi:hypothetical protein
MMRWRGLDKTGLIGGAVVGAIIILGALYLVGINTNTASRPGGDSQATGTGPTSPSGAPSKGTTVRKSKPLNILQLPI